MDSAYDFEPVTPKQTLAVIWIALSLAALWWLVMHDYYQAGFCALCIAGAGIIALVYFGGHSKSVFTGKPTGFEIKPKDRNDEK